MGIVESILYAEVHKPPALPIAVMVNFNNYTGPPFIPSVTFEWHNGTYRLSRQQLPLHLSYTITILKSQGQTLSKAVIDIGDKEMAAGCTFVAVSSLTDFNL